MKITKPETKIWGEVLDANGSMSCQSDKEFILWRASYMMENFGISLHGMKNAYNAGILFYGKGGWELKTKPKDSTKPHYWSALSHRWILDL